MANCSNCGAPLPPGERICVYCHTRNDIDLRGFETAAAETEETRICPQCDIPLHSQCITVGEEPNLHKVYIESCQDCGGLFFDPGELEFILEHSVSNVFEVDRELMVQINAELQNRGPNIYRKCPVCRQFMPFKNYGSQCSVIVDFCKGHGIWLDGGELRHIMEWYKAGGKNLQPGAPSTISQGHTMPDPGSARRSTPAAYTAIQTDRHYDRNTLDIDNDDSLLDMIGKVFWFLLK